MAVTLIDTLFDTCMNFIVKHISLVDSFVGLPDLIGEKIFRKFISENSVISSHDVLRKFVEAYESLVLKRLSLCKNLLILNEYFDSIIIISNCVTELCLCSCYLGENHDIYNHIADFLCLKKLCLRNNSMNDTSIRLLTLRMRMYGIGGEKIEYLDFADNNFTDKMIPRLSTFPKLNFLNLTGSKISNNGIKILINEYNFNQVFEHQQHIDIINEGWATILLENWITQFTKKREEKLKRIDPFLLDEVEFRKIMCSETFRCHNSCDNITINPLVYRLKVPETVKSSHTSLPGIPLVFQKSVMPDYVQPPMKKIKL